MKKSFFILVLSMLTICIDAQNTLSNTYDSGGRLTERKLVVVVGGGSKFSKIHEDSLAQKALSEFKVYPNPASSELNIEGELPGKSKSGTIIFLNSAGQEMFQDSYNTNKKTLDVSTFSDGIYFLEILTSEKKSISFKIIISK